MKFPQLLICIFLYLFLSSHFAIAQDDQIYLDSNHILLGENYALVNYDSTTDVLAPSILAPNYRSSKQHIVIYNNCSSTTLANAIEILPTNASGLVCDNLQQATFTVSSSLINYSYQFFVNGELVQEEENLQVNEQTHTLLIDSPKENATLMIINEQGCSLAQELDLGIGEPRFSFTSPTYESSQLILARENITFTNLSTDHYVRSEWDFGDLTSPLTLLNTATSTKVNYSYPISGTYNVTLRIYNHAGCFLETTKQVAVGKGYSIMVPNVFSPNNDGINDFFRPLTTGLSTIRFSVYDQNGNLIYNENISEPDPSMITGIAILGWDGKNAPKSTYFIYTVEGLLHDGTTTVEKTGTFLLLQ